MNYLLRIVCFITLLLPLGELAAQTRVFGVVSDSAGNVIPDVNIQVVGGKLTTTSSLKGAYSLEVD